jgi:uncharacterized YigZ family protein
MITDTYKTIELPSEALFKDKGSRFLAYAYPVKNETEIKEIVARIKKEHHSARHHCYAWRLGQNSENYRANDDGEPSGTAGRPILGQILSRGLTNILVVVVRYFGGTLLGVSGLINAYREAASEALKVAITVDKIVEQHVRITFSYAGMNDIMQLIKEMQLEIVHSDFSLVCVIELSVRNSLIDQFRLKLNKIDGIIKIEVQDE